MVAAGAASMAHGCRCRAAANRNGGPSLLPRPEQLRQMPRMPEWLTAATGPRPKTPAPDVTAGSTLAKRHWLPTGTTGHRWSLPAFLVGEGGQVSVGVAVSAHLNA